MSALNDDLGHLKASNLANILDVIIVMKKQTGYGKEDATSVKSTLINNVSISITT